MTTNAQAMRAARDARLKRSAAAPAAQSQNSLKTDVTPAVPATDPKVAAAAAPPATGTAVTAAPAAVVAADAPRELVARVVDPARVSTDANIQVTGPFNAKTANPHWLVLVDGEPYAKIALADQDDKEKLAKAFVMDGYAAGIRAGVARIPLEQFMNTVKARPYIAAVRSTEAFSAVESAAKESAKLAFVKKSAQYQDEFLTLLNLVVEAQQRNYMTSNPIKDSFFKAMKSAGVLDPVPLIEAAYAESASAHFEVLFKQASKWASYSAEALADVKQEIMGMQRPVRTAAQTAPSAPKLPANPPKPVPSSRNNVPLVASANGPAPESDKERIRSTFSFRGRMHSKDMRSNG